jgi:hypothetical protein
MKPISYLSTVFFDLMRIGAGQGGDRLYSTSLSLALAMVKLDMLDKKKGGKNIDVSKNKEFLKKLEYIEENTNENLLMPLAVVETIIASTPMERWDKEFEGVNNQGNKIRMENERYATILDMYRLLKESYTPVVEIVAEIIQPYSEEYRVSMESSGLASMLAGRGME